MSFYSFVYNSLHRFFSAIYRLEIIGKENIPTDGAIVASNHTAFSDVILISIATKRQVHYMAKAELFKIPLLAPLIRALGAYPVNRGGADVKSIKTAMSLIEENELIGIFPQGHRWGGKDPRETPIKGGIGMIAYRAKSGVVPVFVYNKIRRTRILHKNYVIIGKYIPYEELGFENGGTNEYNMAAQKIFDTICSLDPSVSSLPGASKPAELSDGKSDSKS